MSRARLAAAFASVCAACGSADGGGDSTLAIVASPHVTGGAMVGAGEVSSLPAGIDCFIAPDGSVSGTCAATFPAASQVTLTATPTGSAIFGQWVDTASGASFDYEESAAFPSPGASERTNPVYFDVDSARALSVAADFVVAR